MKMYTPAFALVAALTLAPAYTMAQAMDPNMPGMQHDAKPADAQGTGIVKAIDIDHGTITLQHEAITSIGWPAMTMPFKVASPDLLKTVQVGDKVKFSLRPAGMNSTVTSIAKVAP